MSSRSPTICAGGREPARPTSLLFTKDLSLNPNTNNEAALSADAEPDDAIFILDDELFGPEPAPAKAPAPHGEPAIRINFADGSALEVR